VIEQPSGCGGRGKSEISPRALKCTKNNIKGMSRNVLGEVKQNAVA